IYEILKRRTIISEKLIFEGIDTKIFSVFSRSDRQQIIKIYNGKAIEPLINLNYALIQLSIESAQLYARDWLVDMPILSVALAFNMKRGVNYGESLIVSFFKLKNANLKIPESSILDHLNGQLPAEIIKNPAVVNAIQLGSMAHYASSIIQPEQSKLSTSRADQSLCEVIEAFRALKLT
ncbi:MAG: hypothetical protein JJV97_06165, partial [SAR324 cluster bacterium]|nr:hypothetical protein [SAR324 cluster bacterium]